ncbi:unnamed protein product, partial [Linum tenue]
SSTASSNRSSVSPQITSSLLESLPLFTFASIHRHSASSSSGDCTVCFSKFKPNDQLRLLPLCCHTFHSACIDTWLLSNQTCPLCRSPLHASNSDILKALSSSSVSDSFRLEIGSVSRLQGDDVAHQHFSTPQSAHSSVSTTVFVGGGGSSSIAFEDFHFPSDLISIQDHKDETMLGAFHSLL